MAKMNSGVDRRGKINDAIKSSLIANNDTCKRF